MSVHCLARRGGAIALDVAKGVYFLHSHRIMHLDLKSPNILLSADNTAKIADVGLAHVFTLHSLPAAKVLLSDWARFCCYVLSISSLAKVMDLHKFSMVSGWHQYGFSIASQGLDTVLIVPTS